MGGSMIKKHCPYCHATIDFETEPKPGTCWKCGQDYIVVYRLRRTCLEIPYEKRNYETEVLDYIKKKGKTCYSEIVIGTRISRGKTSQVLQELKRNGVLNVSKQGNLKWVSLKVEA
jgi:hypothetical protein